MLPVLQFSMTALLGKQPLGQLLEIQHSHQRGTEGEERVEEIGNLFEKIIKENFPNLLKERNKG